MPLAPSATRAAGGQQTPASGAGLGVTAAAPPTHLFVYGTLAPGEVRWHHLAPFVVGDAVETAVGGDLYDTELGYPAAMFGGERLIVGRVYALTPHRVAAALAHLDEVEAAVRGLYHRVMVHSTSGHLAWAYQCGEAALLVRRIESGDWQQR